MLRQRNAFSIKAVFIWNAEKVFSSIKHYLLQNLNESAINQCCFTNVNVNDIVSEQMKVKIMIVLSSARTIA